MNGMQAMCTNGVQAIGFVTFDTYLMLYQYTFSIQHRIEPSNTIQM